ncbi:MAG: haloacid dehalogenase [Armatimonadetes bacterium]|nr:haloacid dehalogenase [Armatimonadota bacterium]
MEYLEAIVAKIRGRFDEEDRAREEALRLSRELIRTCAQSIRAIHRAEFEGAETLLASARQIVAKIKDRLAGFPDIYNAGYVQDALKEFAEASSVMALVQGLPLPDPDEIGVDYAAYLNGLGEAIGEMRRYILDIIRQGRMERGDSLLDQMDEIYFALVTFDYPDAITSGLRRTTDMVRGVLERTRGDLTLTLQQDALARALDEARRGE